MKEETLNALPPGVRPKPRLGNGFPEGWRDRFVGWIESELRESGVSSEQSDWQAATECFRRLGAVPVRIVDGELVTLDGSPLPGKRPS